jgi:hypothetical protein
MSTPGWRTGLDRPIQDETIAFCERLFAKQPAGRSG